MATIKAGTYTFKDNIESANAVVNMEFTTTPIASDITADGLISSFLRMRVSTINGLSFMYEANDPTDVNSGGLVITVYNPTLGWRKEGGKTVNISKDTEVTETFYNFFVKNTDYPKTIKAGTYRFNDALTSSSSTAMPEINFTFYESNDADYATYYFNSLWFSNGVLYFNCKGVDLNGDYIDASILDTPIMPVYDNGWVTGMTLTGAAMQTVTVTEGTNVDDTNFVTWFEANTTLESGGEEEPETPEEPDTPTIPTKKFTRLYIGDIVATAGSKCFKRLTTYYNPALDITDLSNTTWYVPSGWEVTPGLGIFDVTGTVTGNFFQYGSLLTVDFDGVGIGYTYNAYGYYEASTNISIRCSSLYRGLSKKEYPILFTFTGGTDATNADLIAWLYANGELQ